jgi:hypothetical protein
VIILDSFIIVCVLLTATFEGGGRGVSEDLIFVGTLHDVSIFCFSSTALNSYLIFNSMQLLYVAFVGFQ